MTEPGLPAAGAGNAVYVYGIVPADAPDAIFAGLRALDDAGEVRLVRGEHVAAVTSTVDLADLGEDAIREHAHDREWLEQKVRSHDAVLRAAVGRTPVVPFRFGALWRNDDEVRAMLDERGDLVEKLRRLIGRVELGVKGFFDSDAFREQATAERAPAEESSAGTAYMRRRQLDREVADAAQRFAEDCARRSHEALAAAADDARLNAPRETNGTSGRMILNGAYLVRVDAETAFRSTAADLERTFSSQRVTYEVTGPWPPYNFVDD